MDADEKFMAEAIADKANSTAAILRTGRRPIRSLSGPATIIAKVAVSASDDTDHPSSILVSSNSTSINPTTPEITDASNPIRNPPSATMRATMLVNRVLSFIALFPVSVRDDAKFRPQPGFGAATDPGMEIAGLGHQAHIPTIESKIVGMQFELDRHGLARL